MSAHPLKRATGPTSNPSGSIFLQALTAICLLGSLLPPYLSVSSGTAYILFTTAILHQALQSRSKKNAMGWVAISLALGYPGLGTPWLLGLAICLKFLLSPLLQKQSFIELKATISLELPVLIGCLSALHLIETKFFPLGLLIFIVLSFLLANQCKQCLRSIAEELLWFGFLAQMNIWGLWPLTLAALTLLLVSATTNDLLLHKPTSAHLSQQMLIAEKTLRSSEQKFQKDKEHLQKAISIAESIDNFQGQALLANNGAELSTLLIDTVKRLQLGCELAILAPHDGQVRCLSGSPNFPLQDFQMLPQGEPGALFYSQDKKCCLCLLEHDLLFALKQESNEPNTNLEQLLARAGLIIRILQQKKDLATAFKQKSAALDELAQSQAQLLQSEKLAAIGQLAAGVAHEINSPLAAIHLQLQLAGRRLKKNDQQGVQRSLEICTQANKRVKNIIESLLAHAAYSDGNKTPLQLNLLIKQTLNLFEAHFEKYAIDCRYEEEPLGQVLVNEQEVEQILSNILANATDALLETTENRCIHISQGSVEGERYIQIANNGPPIPEERLAKLFDPFFTSKEVGKGIGLGLSIAHQLAKRQGGRIEAENKEGWVLFTLFVPQA